MPRRRQILCGLPLAFLAPSGPARAEVAAPIALGPSDGALRPLGGLVLDREAFAGGGISGLHLDSDLRLTAITDRGRWITGQLTMDGERPSGVAGLDTGPLRDGAGAPLPRGMASDAEALARLPDGTWLIAFERWHRIRAYRRLDGPGTFVEAPPGIEQAPRNGGLESLTVLADGRWLAIAESLAPENEPDLRAAWIGGPGRWRRLAYRPTPGFDPTDAAALPDGGALVLERRFTLLGGFSGRIIRLSPAALSAGGVLSGTELLRLSHPLPMDNWEGIAVASWQGRLLVAVASDDNQSPLQRSLLLLFALREP